MPNDDPAGRTPWTVLKTLQWTTDYFKRHNLQSPRIDAEILLAHSLRCERIDLYLRYDQPLNEDELTRFKRLIKRRLKREPVAYIVGVKEFWSRRFEVAPSVLIPRPDTECLVEAGLRHLSRETVDLPGRILELGTGSGAVITALACERPDCRYWASDRSWPVIATARKNARSNGVDHLIRFFLGRWLDPIAPGSSFFDMILSNPPYISSPAIERLDPEIRLHEPVTALDGGPDGLREIGAIIVEAHHRLKPGGVLLLEIGFDQRAAVELLASASGAYEAPQFHKDFGGHDRVVGLRKKVG
ncbi:MAG: peptide chain release factor N(5)-glutamine methyltransferase [Desulfobacteraceae bacterium]|nr:MAG: peptide chain release factor N(5)-glutamine methyltransferase [Desulfobacteraceae bacterium]